LVPLLTQKSEARVKLLSLAQGEANAEVERMLMALATSFQIQGEDCLRAAGYLIPEAERFDTLVRSGLMERLVQGAWGEAGMGAVRTVVDEIALALERNADARALDLAICDTCGCLLVEGQSETCPSCGAADVAQVH
jgi:hypothetical protein